MRDTSEDVSIAAPPSMASNHLYGTFTKFQQIHKATEYFGSQYPGSLQSTRHISVL